MKSPDWSEHRVTAAEAGQTVEQVLRGPLGVSGRRLQRLTRSRGFRVNGQAAHTAKRVREGDLMEVRTLDRLPPRPDNKRDHGPPIPVVFEDGHVVVLDKPPGIAVHPSGTLRHGTVVQRLAQQDETRGVRAGIHAVHRLDRDTSGLLLVARTPGDHATLDGSLRSGEVGRTYLALTHGAPDLDQGTITLALGPDPTRKGRRCVDPSGDPAVTRFRVMERHSGGALLELTLETGRTHQIRAHLAHLGHPVLGDRMYGAPAGREHPLRTALHAHRLRFPHPASGEVMELESPLPADLQSVLARLRRG